MRTVPGNTNWHPPLISANRSETSSEMEAVFPQSPEVIVHKCGQPSRRAVILLARVKTTPIVARLTLSKNH
jgi:hypothetical protein